MKRGVILCTALLPTVGHKALIDFSYRFLSRNSPVVELDVIICSRTFEPISGDDRVASLREEFSQPEIYIHHFKDDAAPQNPNSVEEWNYWRDALDSYGRYDYVFSSEPYGDKLAELVSAEFIPFDPNRVLYNVKSSKVRTNFLVGNYTLWESILPYFQRKLKKNITIFGQESTGKTTLTRMMELTYPSYITDEWARPYLELMSDPTVTDHKMKNIVNGQFALLQMGQAKFDRPFCFHDTDLLSTIGYYRIYKGKEPDYVRYLFEKTKSDLYILMNDEIPFEPDPLRYGGNERESTKQFWVDLLEEFKCRYYEIKSTDSHHQALEAEDAAFDLMREYTEKFAKFERD